MTRSRNDQGWREFIGYLFSLYARPSLPIAHRAFSKLDFMKGPYSACESKKDKETVSRTATFYFLINAQDYDN